MRAAAGASRAAAPAAFLFEFVPESDRDDRGENERGKDRRDVFDEPFRHFVGNPPAVVISVC